MFFLEIALSPNLLLICCVQDKKSEWEKNPAFSDGLEICPFGKKAGFLATHNFLSCTQVDLTLDRKRNFARTRI